MKFLVDECMSRTVFDFLKTHYDTKYVQDIMPAASDNEILEKALLEGRIIVTRDKDFGDMVFRDRRQHVGVVLLRLQAKHPVAQITMLKKMLAEHAIQLEGNFTVATDFSIKIIKMIFS